MSKKNKKEDESLIDELIELKFGKGAKNDPRKGKDIVEYLEDLYYELDSLNENDDDEECEDHESPTPHFDREMVSTINSDDGKDEMIPFVVVKKEKTTIDIKCPYCGDETKVFLSKFRGSQYDDYDCPKCKKTSLAKLNFNPELKVFVEKK